MQYSIQLLFALAMVRFTAAVFASLALMQMAGGVVVISGASNTTAPPGQPYFNNIGAVGAASAIYLGNRWVLSANHVANDLPANATFGGTSYATESGSFQRLKNPVESGLSTFTDIVLFRLGSDPGLPSLAIASAAPTVGMDVMMIGRGRTQQATPTYWQVTTVPETGNLLWNELSPPNAAINAAGFKTTPTQTLRWGENNIAVTNQVLSYGNGDVYSYHTVFNDGARTHEAQGVNGDSGGASLSFDGVSWSLSGMMAAVSTFNNQPFGSETAVLGNRTYMADLSYYRNEIMAIIPEPGSASLWILAGISLALRRTRSFPIHPRENP